jgi:hypothetical protein
LLLAARNPSFVTAVPSSSAPEEIADAVSRWQAIYQPLMPAAAPPPVKPVEVIETAPHLKEVAASWFAEARKQDAADQDEIRSRVNRVLGRNGILG